MAIYDPSLNLTDALRTGYTRMVLINANGDNSINLGLRYRRTVGYSPAYDYSECSPRSVPLKFGNSVNDTALIISLDLETTSTPNLGLVCNTDAQGSYPCFVNFFIQMPTFERTMISQQVAMSWLVSLPNALR